MTITHSVQQEFLDEETQDLIYIPCRPGSASAHSSPMVSAAAGPAATRQSFSQTQPQVPPLAVSASPESTKGERWTEDEHARFLQGMELFKAGPWKKIAGVVGTRDARQTMSHAQKYRQKIKRRKSTLQTQPPEPPRRVDHSGARATSATKRMRTSFDLETAGDAERVARPQHVSPGVQWPREALDVGERATTGLASATGLIAAETLLAVSAAVNVGSGAGTFDRGMDGADNLLTQQRTTVDAATLEPLEIDAGVSVVHDSWLAPDKFWDFLDGIPGAQPDVAGSACAEADSEPRSRDEDYQ
jgi:SHAQKYF class myb-like DNA-binding protein